uniref:Uncharacterized protein n=1 Tax=Hippocampus comes TaxID=109280 RepID=A0A3Q2XUA3_HIPCM
MAFLLLTLLIPLFKIRKPLVVSQWRNSHFCWHLLAQKCAPGFYRDAIGLFLGKCVPCNCHGHSDQCLDGSGICLVISPPGLFISIAYLIHPSIFQSALSSQGSRGVPEPIPAAFGQ